MEQPGVALDLNADEACEILWRFCDRLGAERDETLLLGEPRAASLNVAFSFITTSRGMFFGSKKPIHDVNVKLGMPLSTAVGTSGAKALRFAAVIASGLTFAVACGWQQRDDGIDRIWTWSSMTSVSAGAVPR